jgi:hypothetical protein
MDIGGTTGGSFFRALHDPQDYIYPSSKALRKVVFLQPQAVGTIPPRPSIIHKITINLKGSTRIKEPERDHQIGTYIVISMQHVPYTLVHIVRQLAFTYLQERTVLY